MNNRKHGEREEESSQSLALGDIYYILFRQKWIIALSILAGLIGAIAIFLLKPPLYQSEAKLYIRYVVDSESFNPPGEGQEPAAVKNQDQSIINTEIEILRSYDLARQVVEAVGPDTIARAGGGTNQEQMAGMVMRNLIIEPSARSSMISVIFQNADHDLATKVLNSIILVYYKKHADAHKSLRVMGDFLTRETSRLQEDLARTDQQLMEAKRSAGVVSVDDAKKAYTEQISKIRIDLYEAEEELAGHQALLEQSTNMNFLPIDPTNTMVQVPPAKLEEYNRVCSLLGNFVKREQDLRVSFTTNSLMVKEAHGHVLETEKEKQRLEQMYPQLASMLRPSTYNGQTAMAPTGLSEAALVESFKRRVEVLKSQLRQTQADAVKLDEWSVPILNLQRQREVLEGQVKFFSGKLQQANVDESLGSGRAPNIGMIDPPTPAFKARPKKFKKQLVTVAMAPVCAGLALAFLIELLLDSSVRRPSDVEKKLRLPLFISIPRLKRNGNHGELAEEKSDSSAVSVWRSADPLRRFYEGLRDRLIVYFEVRNLTHKPKLVAVTGCSRGAGVTGVAAGLAATLSETGDGNVLLVEMNLDQQGAAHEFYKGKLRCGLEHALEHQTRDDAMVQTNLYVAAGPSADDQLLPRILPKRFTQLMPKLRASEYDYIIFDMPPVSQTTITPRLAAHMDMVLLVIESEKNSREVVQKANSLLAESKATVSVVLNKVRTYVPSRLNQELLEDQR